ncbi:MAG TPA: L-histidine N(alpha)-methyltransferase [Steroidobacteraceae bacterium]|jgi:dimethylhistidine N-methyltransferase|nr:L-histidine N(alpha)-methyltransferase [Steroidobacteraceae bacterium]
MLDVLHNRVGQADAFRADVLSGLLQQQKTLPARWLYDDRGSELFELITGLPEYYLTRTETAILNTRAQEIARFCGERAIMLEYGAGAGIKTEILIHALASPRLYVPIDIAGDFLDQTVTRFRRRFPNLLTKSIVADFTADFDLPSWMPTHHNGLRVAFFPGSTIGNLNAAEVAGFLQRVRRHVGGDGRMVVGVDMRKDLRILIPAYADAAGITAQFNLNLLRRINRELAGNFVLDAFRHEARWNETESAIEMHLVSGVRQKVMIGGNRFAFEAGESIHTESSRKYAPAAFEAIALEKGWRVGHRWTDRAGLFSVFGLE